MNANRFQQAVSSVTSREGEYNPHRTVLIIGIVLFAILILAILVLLTIPLIFFFSYKTTSQRLGEESKAILEQPQEESSSQSELKTVTKKHTVKIILPENQESESDTTKEENDATCNREAAAEQYSIGFSLWVSTKDPAQSDPYYKKALELCPDYAPALSSYGFSLGAFHDDFRTGERYIKKAMELDPSWAYAPFNLGLLYSLEGRHEESLQWVKYAVDNYPDHPDHDYFVTRLEVMKDHLSSQ